ncbi:MAG: hypothetical protein J5818_07365 [Eggerthellaceae bacterium]|nr:hypothetical protein [Eggerthellaceae bacterium]
MAQSTQQIDGTMPHILILGGFLGSGKTTLLLKLADYMKQRSQSKIPVAIIENEIGEVGIDDDSATSAGYEVTSIVSGCACCTLKVELISAIRQIADDLSPDLIVVEATGVAIPDDIAANIVRYTGADVAICTLIDASRWRRIHVALQHLLDQQLTSADVVCVNKCDLVGEAELAFIDETLEEFAPTSDILHVSAQAQLAPEDCERILNLHADSISHRTGNDETESSHHSHHHHDHGSAPNPIAIKTDELSGEVRARIHENAAVASAVLYPRADDAVPFDAIVEAMSHIAAEVDASGGIIGHIKASADNGKSRVKASIVTVGQQPDVIGDSAEPLTKRHVIKLVAIVMGVDAVTLQNAMASAF